MSPNTMSALQFPVNALPRSLEDFLREVRLSRHQELRMPILLREGGVLGGAVHTVQVVASWAQNNDSELTLRLPHAFADHESTRERFASTLPGMAALYFADSINCNGISFNRYKALEVVAPRVSAMQTESFRDTLRGQSAALCCFAGARNEFLRPLYTYPEPGRVREASDFRVLLQRILREVGGRTSERLKKDQLDYLSGLVYQLFLNADEHGSFNATGGRYEHAIRGVAIRMTTIRDIVSLVTYAGDDAPLNVYLNRLALLPKTETHPRYKENHNLAEPIHLVEISVFDTGPGLALRWLADKYGRKSYEEITPEEEMEAVLTCFEKHSTTKASQFFGQGLSQSLTAMKCLNAFMTLRTGRLSLYQDFSKPGTAKFQPKNRFQRDMGLAEIVGTGYTVCFRVN